MDAIDPDHLLDLDHDHDPSTDLDQGMMVAQIVKVQYTVTEKIND